MKKIFAILILAISLTSCSEQTISKRDLPIEIVTLKESQKFDTILQIKTDKKVFIFDKKNEYIGAYDIEQMTGILIFIGVLMGLIIGAFIRLFTM